MIDTTKVSGRRRLRFASYEDVLDDARTLAAGPTRSLGNLTLGQVCQHLANAVDKCVVGGERFRVPFSTRILARIYRQRILNTRLRPGFKLPKDAEAVLIPAEANVTIALTELEQAITRLRQTTRRFPHPAFGAMSVEQWDQFHLRHAEMHLSFILPG